MTRVVISAAALVAALGIALAGCTTPTEPVVPDSTLPVQGPETNADPIELVNLWRVTQAVGTGPDSWLRLAGRELLVWTDCGIAGGDWRASGGLFVASIYTAIGDQTCLGERGGTAASLDWLLASAAFVASGDGFDLLDRDGAVVAHLEVDGSPPTQSEVFTDEYTRAPEVTDEVRAMFPPPPELPSEAAEVTDILGRWQPLDLGDGDPPYVQFDADGSWIGSDGCNGMGGRWRVGADGHFLATGGPSTLIGCFNSPAPAWVSVTALVGMVDGQLVLYDMRGDELGVLVRP